MTRSSLKELLAGNEIVLIPGAGGPFETRLIEQAGFEAAYISGYSVAAHRFGVPDIGLIAFKEMRDAVEAICDVVSIPVIVDCDTGYGGLLNVRQTVRAFETAGAAAVQIEDQTWPKRCGHMKQVTVEAADIAVQKIEAAVAARRSDDFLVVARTDARKAIGFDEALGRCRAYKAAGADIVLMHGPHDIGELGRLAAEVAGPHFVSVGEGEFTDDLSLATLNGLGYRAALFPSSPLRTAGFAVRRLLAHVKSGRDIRALAGEMLTLDDINDIVGLGALDDFAARIRKE